MARGPSLPATDSDAVALTLTAFVNANIMARDRRIRPDDDFEVMGIDSMAVLKVLLFVEAEFGFATLLSSSSILTRGCSAG